MDVLDPIRHSPGQVAVDLGVFLARVADENEAPPRPSPINSSMVGVLNASGSSNNERKVESFRRKDFRWNEPAGNPDCCMKPSSGS